MLKSCIQQLSLVASLVTLSLSAQAQQCIEGSGVIVEQEIVTSADFINISNDSIAKLVVSQSDVNSVVVKVDDNILEYVNLEVENDTLAIDFKQIGDSSCYTNVDLEVHVSQSDYEKLINAASGSISAGTDLQLDALEVVSTGSGDISLKGSIDNQTVVLEGAGHIFNFDVTSATVNARNVGAGNIEVTATNTLQAALYGSGDISYKGNPANRFTDEQGSGRLINASGNTDGDNTGGDGDTDGGDEVGGGYLTGDIDQDGDIDKKDVRKFRRALRNGQTFDFNYDFNFDGIVNKRDARALAKLCTRPKCKVND